VEEFAGLSFDAAGVSSSVVKGKIGMLVMLAVFALSRIPGLLPQNFSAAYALMFCAGVYFTGRMAWWLPLTAMLVTDFGLNLYYYFAKDIDVFNLSLLRYLLANYGAYAVLIWLGRRFKPKDHWLSLLGGGVLGALLFYLITNTASWLFNPFNNPEYTKTFIGWLTALTKGTAGYPQTWEFFRNTLLSGGLFTGLFAGAMKLTEAAESPKEKGEAAEEGEEEAPEEAKA
jgi:hypothetical protein